MFWWREGSIAAAAVALCVLGGVLRVDDTVAPPPISLYGIATVSAVAVLMRHRMPWTAVAVTTACGALAAPVGVLPTPLVVAPAAICAFSVAARTERDRVLMALIPAAVLPAAVPPFVEDQFSWEDTSRLVIVAATPLVATGLGRLTRHRRTYLAMMEERTRRAEENRDSEARRRVIEERVRIARDLHDLVAHQITLANAQANVAVHLYDTDPQEARASMDELLTTTRNALQELRATVGLLRQDDEPVAPVEPAPGLSRLPELLESFHRAGLAVSVQHAGTSRNVPPAIDLTLYRIVQEALTNVTKHAGVADAQVRLNWSDQNVTLAVVDQGGAPRTVPGSPPGHGLAGMRERVGAVGGEFDAGHLPEGGFHVSATLPLPTSKGGPDR